MARVAQREIDGRRRAMTALLRARSYVPVGDLCRRFGISEATARRDLTALHAARSVVRTRGGAMADYDRRFAPFADRLAVAARAKRRIAAAAVAIITPGTTVFLNAGTTLFAVAERLRRRPVPLTVVTNSLAVAERLAGARGIAVDLLGGRLLPSQLVLLGGAACRSARAYRFDLALLGAEGFDVAGVSNSTADVVALQRTVARRSARHAVLADATKAGTRAPAQLFDWPAVDLLITDAAGVPPGAKARVV